MTDPRLFGRMACGRGDRNGSFSFDTAAKSGDRLSIWGDADGNHAFADSDNVT
jgi:hypothetical protein